MKGLIFTLIVLGFGLFITGKIIAEKHSSKEQQEPKANRVESFLPFAPNYVLNYTNVYAEIMRLDIKFSEKVLRQTIVESGHYKSYNCINRMNITGMKGGVKCSENPNGYAIFNTWMDCLENYKTWQTERITESCADYYDFLQSFGYHEGGDGYEDKCEGVKLVIVKQ